MNIKRLATDMIAQAIKDLGYIEERQESLDWFNERSETAFGYGWS